VRLRDWHSDWLTVIMKVMLMVTPKQTGLNSVTLTGLPMGLKRVIPKGRLRG